MQEYPGLVLDQGAGAVRGWIFAVPQPALWSALDAYEGFTPADEARSLFVRRLVPVAMEEGGSVACWIYEYNGALPGE
jgi:gamma-glutamylcyclotransferase (GGCT)/AIG2-like uncharacterized protein YtfP